MAKEKATVKSFAKTYTYDRETKGTWVYVIDGEEGERHSGTNAIYLQKQDYPSKPGENIEATFVIK